VSSINFSNRFKVLEKSASDNANPQILHRHTQGITSVAFITSEQLILESQDYVIRLWQLKTHANNEQK